jgi:pimeloyl-ACP methyl ester carboxylesterase
MQKNKTQITCNSGYALVNELKMYYEIYGQGMPLVLIHGGGSTIQTTFGNVLHHFAKSHKVIAVEMQAHGRTADIDRPLSFEKDADDIAALLKFLKIEKANIFGFSNGASTTLQCAIRHPALVNKIIVASTFFKKSGAPSWFWDVMQNTSFSQMPQQLKDAFLNVNPSEEALLQMYHRDVARMLSFNDIDEEQLKAITAKTLIIIGKNDIVSEQHVHEMQALIPNSKYAIVGNAHGDYIGEITTTYTPQLIESTVELIDNFLL